MLKHKKHIIIDAPILILDYDGVFVDSLDIKGDAFIKIFNKIDKELSEKIKSHHLANPSLTRYEKIKIYYYWNFNRNIKTKELSNLSFKFAKYTIDKLLKKKPSKFISSLLELRSDKFNYIATRSVKSEVNEYISKFNLDKYVNKIFDNRTSKEEIILNIANTHKINPYSIVYIGDSKEDRAVSENTGCKFIFYKTGEFNHESLFFEKLRM